MENLPNRVDAKLVTGNQQLSKLKSKPTFVSAKLFNENLVVVHEVKESLTALNKPAYMYVEMSIPDLSKTLMYHFHHNYIS